MLTVVYLLLLFSFTNVDCSFISVRGKKFYLNDVEYSFVGTNLWYGANLGSSGAGGNRDRLKRELDRLHSLGINNLRIQAGSEGPDSEPWRIVPSMQTYPGIYNRDVVAGLDFLLSEMRARNMTAVMCLNNFWHWSGGFAQYVVWGGGANNIPYPGDYQNFELFAAQFYSSPRALEFFENHIRYIATHRNQYTQLLYSNDPTIMSWELANEPRRYNTTWLNRMACLIKSLAPNQLVTTGVEGNISSTNFAGDHASSCIDYATFHLWVQNWNYFNPQNASETLPKALDFALQYIDYHVTHINKPVVLEEFGIARDKNNHAPGSPVTVRDQFYETILLHARLRGIPVNFWAYAGEGRPRVPFGNWLPGDAFIGDPPHEPQGWYSVYDNDTSTLNIIKKYAMQSLPSTATILWAPSCFMVFISSFIISIYMNLRNL